MFFTTTPDGSIDAVADKFARQKSPASRVSHYSKKEFLRIHYKVTSLGTESVAETPHARANSSAVNPSAEFISQRPNGGAPSGKPPP
jgi:hypothetical protein